MRTHIQVALAVAALLYLSWALGLLVAPGAVHAVVSTAPANPVTSAMFGAGAFAFAIVFLIAAHHPVRETLHAAVAGLLLFGFVGGYQMFLGGAMPRNVSTVSSFVINAVIAAYLLLGLSDAVMNMEAGGAKAGKKAKKRAATRPAARRARR
jgi:hypothetical protein